MSGKNLVMLGISEDEVEKLAKEAVELVRRGVRRGEIDASCPRALSFWLSHRVLLLMEELGYCREVEDVPF